MIITLNTNIINGINLGNFRPLASYFGNLCGQEHYRLLCYLSSIFNGKLFVDIGTSHGDSALALASNRNNRVISFDIIKYNYTPVSNCEYIIGNFELYGEKLLDSMIMLYDIPHSGDKFVRWCNYLRDSNWNGFLILDDYTYDRVKANDWNALDKNFVKLDVSKYGHFSGTGIVSFSKNIEFRLE